MISINRKFFTSKSLLVSTAIAVSLGHSASFAQTSQTSANSGQYQDEIVVTAQRREQSILDVPIAVQALPAEALTEAGVSSLYDLPQLSPSLNILGNSGAIVPYLRGIGSPNVVVGAEVPVSIYVDDVYIANPAAIALEYNNIEQVEVLKGPQGTLFGRNTTGGLIHVRTMDPSTEGRFKGSVSYGNYGMLKAKGYATLGLNEDIATDLAVIFQDQSDGFGENLTTGEEYMETDMFAIRNKYLINAGDNTEIRVALDYAKSETSELAAILEDGVLGADALLVFGGCLATTPVDPANPTAAEFGTCFNAGLNGGSTSTEDFYDTVTNRNPSATTEGFGGSIKINHDFGDLDFVSITSYRESDTLIQFDQAVSAIPFVPIDAHNFFDTFTQEFQLIGENAGVNWILGAFYLDNTSAWPSGDGLTIQPGPGQTAVTFETDKESISLFGDGTFALTDSTNITGGIRWTQDKLDAEWALGLFAGGVPFATIPADNSEKFDEITYRAVLDHTFQNGLMTYASYSHGYKSGAFNATGVIDFAGGNLEAIQAYRPEFIDAYEIGLKGRLFDGIANVNAAAFMYDVEDLQVQRVEQGSVLIQNAAEAEILGFEMDFTANLTDSFKLNGGFTFLDHEFSSFPEGVITTPQTDPAIDPFGLNTTVSGVDLSGNEIPWVSDFNATLGGSYSVPLSSGDLLFGANAAYNSGFVTNPSARYEQDDYTIVNAFVSWTHDSEEWGGRIFGENLLDEEYRRGAGETATFGDFYLPGVPTIYGVELFVDF